MSDAGMIRKIGTMIRDARKRAEMTQGELGSAIGISAPALCDLEGGKRASTPAPEEMVRIHDALHDPKLLQEYCNGCPVRKRIIIRKFKPLNNILPGSHIAIMKVNQKLVEASERLSLMLPKMLKAGFINDPDFREYCDEAVLRIIDSKRGYEELLDRMIEEGLLTHERLQLLVELQQRQCVEKGHHIESEA